MTVKLFQFARGFGVPNPSPFCMKLECFLRMTGIAHEIVVIANPGKGPKSKAPFIEVDGQRIGDSQLAIEYLVQRFGVDPDAHLSPAEKAVARAMRLMLEDHLYFVAVHSRWLDPVNAPKVRDTILAGLPRIMRGLVFRMIQRGNRAKLNSQGLGRHSVAEMTAMGVADIEALSAFLADKPFLMGDEPSLVDCAAHAFVSNLIRPPLQGALHDCARSDRRLIDYDRRMMRRFFAGIEGVEADPKIRLAA